MPRRFKRVKRGKSTVGGKGGAPALAEEKSLAEIFARPKFPHDRGFWNRAI
jgi:hypothetical protein